jgi:hypothetical protein
MRKKTLSAKLLILSTAALSGTGGIEMIDLSK